ncbi:MAG: hypothetical protein ACREDR_07725 [Blastocatellia bacterium]
MSAFAPSQYHGQGTVEMPAPQMSGEDLQKLQEIHELINLLLEQLPAVPQTAAASYPVHMAQPVPYTYSHYQLPWGRTPFVDPHGF